MANVSVAELLLDPTFVDQVTVLRQYETVDTTGVAVRSVEAIKILASIQSNDDRLMMTPDLSRTEASYEIITTFPLATPTNETNSDVILWLGALYRVTAVGRFGNFRFGFGQYEGIMELLSIPVPLWLAQWDKTLTWDGAAAWDDAISSWDAGTRAKWDDLITLWDGTR